MTIKNSLAALCTAFPSAGTLAAIAAAIGVCIFSPAASAAIIQIDFSSPTTGSPDPATGVIVLEFDPDTDTPLTNVGVLFSDLNFDLDGNVGFTYFSFGQLVVGDDIDTGVGLGENDFFLNLVGLKTPTPSVSQFSLAQATQGFIANDANAVVFSITELDSFPVSEVPIPGALALMLSGLVGMGWLGKRKAVRG